MKRFNQLIQLIVAVVFLSTASAWAHNDGGADGHEDGIMTTQQTRSERAETARQSVEERVEAIRQQVEARKATIRQDVCERQQEQLQNTLPRLSNGATNVKNTIDTMYDRVVGFYQSGQLTVSNYDELVADIETAKADAETSLETVSSFQVEINCENTNLGEQLDAYRTAISDTRESLKSYRDSLVALISALRAEAAEVNAGTSTQAEDQSPNNTAEGVENE